MNRSKVGILSLLLLTAVAACEDSTGPGESLSQAEAEALASVLLTQALEAGDPTTPGAPASAAPVARQVVDFSNEVSVELPCALGGTVAADVAASGTIDSQSGAANLQYTSTKTHQSCQVPVDDAGASLTLDGSPNITSTFQFGSSGTGSFEAGGSIVGSVDWTSGERSGSCVVSLEFSGSSDGQGNLSFSLEGGICSAQVSQQVGVTAT